MQNARAAAVIRTSLRTADYMRHNSEPFAGLLHDFSKPLAERFNSREHVSCYIWKPAKPGGGRGFYLARRGYACDRNGSIFDLRLAPANEFISSRTIGYYYNDSGEYLEPIIARLPNRRGFLAGWTMGNGMASELELTIYETEREAAQAAHNVAESAAERQREHEAEEAARLEAEEAETV